MNHSCFIKIILGILFMNLLAAFGFPQKNDVDGKVKIQKFYFNETWNECLAFIYTGLGGAHAGGHERVLDSPNCHPYYYYDFACPGPKKSKPLLRMTSDGRTIYDISNRDISYICPIGYTYESTIVGYCCENEQLEALKEAKNEICTNGGKSRGIIRSILQYEYFYAIFAETCNDLICEENEKCFQINKYFAKCCEITKPFIAELNNINVPSWLTLENFKR